MPALQYDPSQLAPLRSRAAAALDHLLATHSTDPAAASALRVAAVVRAHLAHGWLPAIDRLVASDAMLAWTSRGPAWARGVMGADLGVALAERAVELLSSNTPPLVAELTAALRVAADDEVAMAAFFATLGPENLLRLTTALATVETATIDLPSLLRAELVAVARDGGLARGYGRELVRAAVDQHERWGATGDAGLALSFLFHGDDLPGAIVIEAVDEAILQEHAFAARMGYATSSGAALWQSNNVNGARGLWLDFDEPYRGDDLDGMVAQDPMYALLGQLARDPNGAAGRSVFTDADRARYLFDGRDVLADHGRAVARAAATAAAGPDVHLAAPVAVRDDAALVASSFVNLFGRSNAADVGHDDRASTAAARVVGAHLYGVQHATGSASTVRDEDRARLLPEDQRELVTGADPAGAIGELTNRVFAEDRPAAVFDPAALAAILGLAARTDASVEVLRHDLAHYQRGLAATTSARLATADVARSDAADYLDEVMADSGRLEGTIAAHVGREARRRGRDADQVWSFWIGAIGETAERAGDLLGPPWSTVVGPIVGGAEHVARGELADAEELAATDSEARADLAGERLAYMWLRELQVAGLVTAQLPPGILVDGALPAYDDLVVALATGGPAAWEVTTVIQQFDEASGALVDIDGPALLDAMQAAHARHVEPLG